MSKLYVVPTEFTNLRGGGKSFGVRVFDAYGQSYDANWDDIPTDDMQIIERVIESRAGGAGGVVEAVDNVEAEHGGIQIENNFYDWSKIKHFFE